MRVSAFVYLYRRIHQGWSDEKAQLDLQTIWTPDRTWQALMQEAIERKLEGRSTP